MSTTRPRILRALFWCFAILLLASCLAVINWLARDSSSNTPTPAITGILQFDTQSPVVAAEEPDRLVRPMIAQVAPVPAGASARPWQPTSPQWTLQAAAGAKQKPEDEKDADFEREARKLASQYPTVTTEEQTKIRQQLEAQIEKHFEHRQEQRKREIEELSSRLVSLGVAQQRRQENKAEIVKRRLNDLLNPNTDLQWDDLTSTSGAGPTTSNEERSRQEDQAVTKFVEEFNDLYSQGRFADAEVIAKKARVLSPKDLALIAMELKAQVARQNQLQPTPAFNPSVSAQESRKSEPTVESIPLSTWLKRLETERSLPALEIALAALQLLQEDVDSRLLVQSILRMSLSIPALHDPNEGTDITRKILDLLRSAPSDVVIDEIAKELQANENRRLTKGFKSLIATFFGSNCRLPNSESQHFEKYYSNTYITTNRGWFQDFPIQSTQSLRPEIRRQSRRLVNALVKIAAAKPAESDWVVETSSYILENSEQPLTTYPNLIPLVEKMFSESKVRYTKGIAATLLGESHLQVPEVLAFFKSALQAGSAPGPEYVSPIYASSIQSLVKLSRNLPDALKVLTDELTERAKEYQSDYSNPIRVKLQLLLRGVGDIGDPAKTALPLLREIAQSQPVMNDNRQVGPEVVIDGQQFQIEKPSKQIPSIIKHIEAASPQRNPDPLPEDEASGNQQPSNNTENVARVGDRDKTIATENPDEPELTFDGVKYSAWLTMLETERRPEKLAMAIDACSRLAKPGEVDLVIRRIFLAAGSIEGSSNDEVGRVHLAALVGLAKLPAEKVIDEYLAALQDNSSYTRGRAFQAFLLTQGLPYDARNLEIPFGKRADEIIGQLLKFITSENKDAEKFLEGASIVWRCSQRSLDDFPTLKKLILRFVEERRLNPTTPEEQIYSSWSTVSHILVMKAPQTPDLARMLVNHLKKDVHYANSSVYREVEYMCLGRLRQHAEPIVPDLVDLFLDQWKHSSFYPANPRIARENNFHNQICTNIVRALGEIHSGENGFALLRQLSLIAPPGYKNGLIELGGELFIPVEIALKKFDSRYDATKTFRLLDDKSLVTGRWTMSDGGNVIKVTVDADKFSFIINNQDQQTIVAYEIDDTASPRTISFRENDSDQHGLYELTETTLRIQTCNRAMPKPTEIVKDKSELPAGHSLIEFKRSLDEKLFPNLKSPESKPAKKAGLFGNSISNDVAYAWQSNEPYLAPDSEKFFPDDAEAGAKLDQLFANGQPPFEPNEEILILARNGLRRTKVRRDFVVRWVGNSYIWNKGEQNPDAIELTYHAADFKGPDANPFGTRHFAVYFGLSVVKQKTPAILRTLVDLCLKVDDPNDLSRVTWGTATQRDELLAVLEPNLSSDDAAVREKAQVLEQIFTGRKNAFDRATEQAKKRAMEKYGTELAKIQQELNEGSAEARQEWLQKILAEQIALIMDDSFVSSFAACSKDSTPAIRNQIAIVAGSRWIWSSENQNPDAIKLMLELSHDVDAKVRYNSVYYGLSTIRNKDDEVLRRLLELALDDRDNSDLLGRIQWGLRSDKERTRIVLKEWIDGTDKNRAASALKHYKELTGQDAPTADKS